MVNQKKQGLQTIIFEEPPVLTAWATIVGPKEGEGPWRSDFDWIMEDYEFGESSREIAESKLLRETVKLAVSKKNYQPEDIELLVSGDLLNQITSSSCAPREL